MLSACLAVRRWQAQKPSRIAQQQHLCLGVLLNRPCIDSAQRARMLCTLPSLLESLPSTSDRQCHAPVAQPQAFSSHVPRTAAFSKQIRNRSRKDSRGQLQTLCAVKKKSEKNLVCSKTLTVKPDHKDAVVTMCQEVSQCHALPYSHLLLQGCSKYLVTVAKRGDLIRHDILCSHAACTELIVVTFAGCHIFEGKDEEQQKWHSGI